MDSNDANHAVIPDPLDPTKEAQRLKRVKQRRRESVAARERANSGASEDATQPDPAKEQSAYQYGVDARAEVLGDTTSATGAHNNHLATGMLFNTLAVMFRSQEVALPNEDAATMDGVLRRGSRRARKRSSVFQNFAPDKSVAQ